MTDTDDPAVAAARLEEALEKIAALAEDLALRQPRAAGPGVETVVDTVAVAQRLDALIVRLRAALAGRPA